jgi:hypothetical protein
LIGGNHVFHIRFTLFDLFSSPLCVGTRKEVLIDGAQDSGYIRFVVLITPLDQKLGVDIARY